MNVQSGLHADKKGLIENLTESKYSYSIIHSKAVKIRAIKYMDSTGSFQYSRDALGRLSKQARSLEDSDIPLGPNKGVIGILHYLPVPSACENRDVTISVPCSRTSAT